MNVSPASAIVLFGATGDLARRMIWPSLYSLHDDGLMEGRCRIIGAARSDLTADGLRELVAEALEAHMPEELLREDVRDSFLARLDYVRVDVSEQKDFEAVGETLGPCADGALYYLATSPSLYGVICDGLSAAKLAPRAGGLVLEKPIGRDLASSRAINDAVAAVFEEERVFRVDHYLGKETVQNLLALRFGNILFEPLWNAASIASVQITVAETVGAEGRWSYYNETGALRDMVQNHMLQLLCLVAMEPPAEFDPDSVRNEKIKVLRSLKPIEGADVGAHVVAGQYTAGMSQGRPAVAYVEEAGGGPSRTETFVALQAEVENWRWAGVPFFLRTGKRMAERRTEINIQFRCVPHNIFGAGSGVTPNVLRIRLQPQETVELTVMTKEPGLDGMHLKPMTLDLSLSEAFQSYRRRIAYERLLLDALRGETTLFVRRDEVEAAWDWIDRITSAWTAGKVEPKPYAAGSWGPTAAIALAERAGHSWIE
ncbi:MAG: glucose-6-phosphate dehydrogenase [Maricaulaceae bacterium]|jgi:glucose-6-phosphate 1-dehydrogenase